MAPSRRARRSAARVVLALVLAVLAGLTGPGPSAGADAPGSDLEEARIFAMPVACNDADGELRLGACRLLPRRPGAPTLVVWGDSHAREILTGVIEAIGTRPVNLVAYVAGGCPPVDPGHGPDEPTRFAAGCEEHNALAVRDLTRMAERHRRVQVLVAGGWELYRNAIDGPYGPWETYRNDYIRSTARLLRHGLPRLFRTMDRLGITTHLVGQAPMVPGNPPACAGAYDEIDPDRASSTDFAYPCALPRGAAMVAAGPLRRAMRAQLHLMGREHRGLMLMPAQVLCPDGSCPGTVDGAEVWHDPVHISTRASARLAPLFAPVVRAVVATGRR